MSKINIDLNCTIHNTIKIGRPTIFPDLVEFAALNFY